MTKHLIIHGRVHGVGYRDSMRIRAQELGVTGWVRNRRDGTVEAMVQGPQEAVDSIIAWAKWGPPAARVTRVDIDDGIGDFHSFTIYPTA
ncbi:MAG TPA: acylphosphatase [Burkholderiales bacterium]|nr:acylphosphatase [Burkholderiales bacterium]